MQNEKPNAWKTAGIVALTAVIGGSGVGAAYWLGTQQQSRANTETGKPKQPSQSPTLDAAVTPASDRSTPKPSKTVKPMPEPTPEIDLRIKGNRDSRIYHLPDCPNYADISLSNIIWFKTHEQARAAGYRVAKNCP